MLHVAVRAGMRLAVIATGVCLLAMGTFAAEVEAQVEIDVEALAKSEAETKAKRVADEMSFDTLEDVYGDSGESFQGSFGFFVSEGTPSDQPVSTFGVALDDVVVEWREYRLDADTTPCDATDAQCATINISQTNGYEGNGFVHVTVQDRSPYSPTNPKNDCDGNDSYLDAVDDTDCNNNGIPDVTVRILSQNEPAGEIAVLDRIGSTFAYAVDFPVSSSYDSPGVIFIARSGTSNPRVRAQYTDRDDGSGTVGSDHPCAGAAAVEQRGLLEDGTFITLTAGKISLKAVRLTDNGDNDGFADTNETISMFVTVINKSGQDLDNLTASLQSSDPKIECISATTVSFTSPGNPLTNKATRESLTPFVFKVKGDANRSIVNERLLATFQLNVRSEKFDLGSRAIPIALDLDLNASGGGATIGYTESFESAVRTNFLTFTSAGANLDDSKASLALSDGYRCQYNDPAGPNSNSANRAGCFMGFVITANNGYDWHIHSGGAQDNNVGRAYVGTRSLHWGVHPAQGAKRDTTRFSQLEGIRSNFSLSLPVNPTAELSFKHQISLVDNRSTGTPNGESADRAMVALQLADSGTGAAFGNWIKIFPYENEYDAQGTDNFTNCTFDPIDDGSSEDDFFDPLDPFRRLGPSSTCFPEFVFSYAGDTDFSHAPGNMALIGRGEGPGLRGNIDRGTWVQPKFLLDSFKGRRIRMRFLITTVEVGTAVTVNDTNIGDDNAPWDDGWYIDDVQIPQVIQTPVLLSVDNATNAGLPGCTTCTTITPVLLADPSTTAAPGQPIVVDARNSTANSCPSGTLQFKFWNDVNGNNAIDNGIDLVLREWTDNPIYSDAPAATIGSTTVRYGVQVRCSTNFACGSPAAFASITVMCPTTDSLPRLAPFSGPIVFSDKSTIQLTAARPYEAIRGDLGMLRSSGGNFTGTVSQCLVDGATVSSVTDPATPIAGAAFYYLARSGSDACNQPETWSTNHPKEQAGRDAEIDSDSSSCP